MKIVFTIRNGFSVSDLLQLLAEPEVGFDPDFHARASLLHCSNDGPKNTVGGADGQEWDFPTPEQWSRLTGGADAADLHYGPIWVTHAGYGYQFLSPSADGRQEVRFVGADRAFLAQNLLPKLDDPQILQARGTYGTFSGANALEEYRRVKKNWRAKHAKAVAELIGDEEYVSWSSVDKAADLLWGANPHETPTS